MIDADVAVDVEEAHHVPLRGHSLRGKRVPKCRSPAEGSKPCELTAEGFYFQRAVETHDSAEFGGSVLLERLGTLDAQQGHEQHDN